MKTSHAILGVSAIAFVVGSIYNERQKKKEAPIYYVDRLTNNYNARTIPPFGIFVAKDQANNKNLIDHERVHWEQYRRMGLFRFYLEYARQFNTYGYDLCLWKYKPVITKVATAKTIILNVSAMV